MQEIVCQVLFLKILRDKKKKKKKKKKVSTGGSITDEKNMQKYNGFLTILTRNVNFTSAPRTASRQPHSARPPPADLGAFVLKCCKKRGFLTISIRKQQKTL